MDGGRQGRGASLTGPGDSASPRRRGSAGGPAATRTGGGGGGGGGRAPRDDARGRAPDERDVRRRPTLRRVPCAPLHVVEDVHERDERVVRRRVRAEVLVHVAVGRPLRAHVVEVVRRREPAPRLEQVGPLRPAHGAQDVVERIACRESASNCRATPSGRAPRRPTRSTSGPRAFRGGARAASRALRPRSASRSGGPSSRAPPRAGRRGSRGCRPPGRGARRTSRSP